MSKEKTVEERVLAFVKKQKKGTTNQEIREHICPGAETYIPEVDKAIQKLSKKGFITYEDRKWWHGNRIQCPKCKGTGAV